MLTLLSPQILSRIAALQADVDQNEVDSDAAEAANAAAIAVQADEIKRIRC